MPPSADAHPLRGTAARWLVLPAMSLASGYLAGIVLGIGDSNGGPIQPFAFIGAVLGVSSGLAVASVHQVWVALLLAPLFGLTGVALLESGRFTPSGLIPHGVVQSMIWLLQRPQAQVIIWFGTAPSVILPWLWGRMKLGSVPARACLAVLTGALIGILVSGLLSKPIGTSLMAFFMTLFVGTGFAFEVALRVSRRAEG